MPEASLNIFHKCLPAFTQDLKACAGNLTLCNVLPATPATLESFFYDTASQKYKVFGHLLMAEFEINACDVEQNGLYELLQSVRQDWSKRMTVTDMDGGLYDIRPYIMARQLSILNNEYWTVSAGTASGGNWQVDVTSQSGMPIDLRWFLPPERVYIFGTSATGTALETAWRIVSATVAGAGIRLVLASENTNSSMPASKLGNPVTGYLIRGAGNISDYESWCLEGPGLNLQKRVPFWLETTRLATCDDELFRKWERAIITGDNKFFETFKFVDAVEKNKQLGLDYKKKRVNDFFYGKPLANQTLNGVDSLETIEVETGTVVTGLPNEGRCVGKRANAVGIIEQLWECNRGADLQGQVLNLREFFNGPLYDMSRVRGRGKDGKIVIESMTDSYYASLIQLAMVDFFNVEMGGNARYVVDVKPESQSGSFGFWYRKYHLPYPNVEWRVLSHFAFDDMVEAARRVGQEASGTVLWTLDWSGLYEGVVASNRRASSIGDLEKLSAIDPTLACVLKYPKRSWTLTSVTKTNVVECPRASFVLRNIARVKPEPEGTSGILSDYYGSY